MVVLLRGKPSVCWEANRRCATKQTERLATRGARVYTTLSLGVCCMGAEDWNDPHGIIPEQFRERYGDSETVADALRRASSRPSTTSLDERPRCPECNSTHVSAKPSEMRGNGNGRDGGFRCGKSDCMAHFEEPVYNTAIPMNDTRALTFDWIDPEELDDPDTRSALDSPFADADRETAVALAILLRRPWRDEDERRNYPEIARYLPYADSWVGHRVREWRDGDHRDLVGAPRADAEPSAEVDASASVETAADGGTRRSRWGAYGTD
jgi:hypothetical protein